MRYYVVSDVHGFYTPLIQALTDAGFFDDTEPHKLIVLGDLMDRGRDAVKIQNFILEQMKKDAVILIRGNHEDLYESLVTQDCGIPYDFHLKNGTYDTALQLTGFDPAMARIRNYDFADAGKETPFYRKIMSAITVHLLPFLKPTQVRRFFPGEKIVTSQDAVCVALKNTPVDPNVRNVLLCHQFITGAERSDSENVTVGGLDNVDAAVFKDYDYVALGHIHKPQKALRETIRYAGSPLKYSLSEANHRKSVAIVDLYEKGEINVRTVPLTPLHEMRLIEGELDDILQLPYSEDYVAVTVHDEIVPPDAKLTICANVFPNMMRFTVENSKTKMTSDVLVKEKIEGHSVEELFADFYRFQNNDAEPTRAHLDLLEKVCRALEDEER